MNNDVSVTFKAGDSRAINRLKLGQLLADKTQDRWCMAFVDQLLPVSTDNCGQDDHRNRIIKLHNFWDWVRPEQVGKAGEFPLRPGEGLSPFVSLIIPFSTRPRAIRIAMRESWHEVNPHR